MYKVCLQMSEINDSFGLAVFGSAYSNK